VDVTSGWRTSPRRLPGTCAVHTEHQAELSAATASAAECPDSTGLHQQYTPAGISINHEMMDHMHVICTRQTQYLDCKNRLHGNHLIFHPISCLVLSTTKSTSGERTTNNTCTRYSNKINQVQIIKPKIPEQKKTNLNN